MKETISAFAKGQVHIEHPEVSLPEYITAFIEPYGTLQGSISLSFACEDNVRGFVFSTNRRMRPEKKEFSGTRIELPYTFYGKGMEEGDVVQGDFMILSEAGMYRIPYTITARYDMIVTGFGKLKNVEAFAALANSDREEAYRAFCGKRFLNTLKNDDLRFTTLYRALTRDGFSREAMDEFLTAAGVDTGGFDPSDTGTFSASSRKRTGGISNQERQMEAERMICLYQLFLDFRCMKTSPKAWIVKTRAMLSEQLGTKNDAGFYSLYYVHTLLMEQNKSEAERRLAELAEQMPQILQNQRYYAYYLYLSALINGSETFIQISCEKIWKIYKRNSADPFILWILFMMEKDFLDDSLLKCDMAKTLYEKSVVSPVILMEIALLFRRQPALITELSDFNVQVLIFAARMQILSSELCTVIYRMAAHSNVFSVKVYILLTKCYEMNKDRESLQTICHYLIRNDKSDNAYFKWFALGVQEDLRIARLYDYYLYSVRENMDYPLPEKVLQYFKFNMELEYNKKSFLFANIYRFREETHIFEEYQEDMMAFVRQQLGAGRINRHLAYLYSELIDENDITAENAGVVIDLLFSYHVSELPPWAGAVIVTDPIYVSEQVFPVFDREAVVFLYSEHSCILLRDGMRKRFIKNAGKWEKWFYNEKLLAACERFCPDHPGLILKNCERLIQGNDPEWAENVWKIISDAELTKSGKDTILCHLLRHFYEEEDILSLEILLSLRRHYPEYLQTEPLLLNVFLLTGHYEDAFFFACEYGCTQIKPEKLVPMCEYMLKKKEQAYDEPLYALTKEIFLRGKYSENMLEYLIRYADGETAYLLRLREAGLSFSLEVRILEEQILRQALFVRQVPEKICQVFWAYDQDGGYDEEIKTAFLSFLAHETISCGRVTPPALAEHIDALKRTGSLLPDVCKILWLQAFAAGLVDDKEAAAQILDEFEESGRFFGFCKMLPERLKQKYFYTNKAIIELRAAAGADVYCYYTFSGPSRFIRKRMTEVYEGVYAVMIPLFADESLLYYVSLETDRRKEILMSGDLPADGMDKTAASRYGKVDQMIGADSCEAKNGALIDYLREERMNSKLFGP